MTQVQFRPYAKPNRAVHQAQILDDAQVARLVKSVSRTGNPHTKRDLVGVYLSFYSALRAAEIAGLRWRENVLDAEGKVRDHIVITGDIGKNSTARTLSIPPVMIEALRSLRAYNEARYGAGKSPRYVFHPIKGHCSPGDKLTPSAVSQWFRRLYAEFGFVGCSSHSGRRTFITNSARQAGGVGCSLRDVQLMAGHRHMETTAAYVEPSRNQEQLVAGLYGQRAA